MPPAFVSRLAATGASALAALCLLLACTQFSAAQSPDAERALRARHLALREQLARSPFGQPLHLESRQASDRLEGDIHAVVNYPFALVNAALDAPGHWCDVLILHLNIKHCQPFDDPAGVTLSVRIGSKQSQPIDTAFRVDFDYRVTADTSNYLQVQLKSPQGPLGTRNYRIALEASALDATHSLIHLSYSYEYDTLARIAMQGYLATLGSGKVGFSVASRQPTGLPVYVDNVRGVVERNTMRYFLAIEAYLGTYDLPPRIQVERRLRDWFSATERYARQLHELDEAQYLDMKRDEIARMQVVAPRGPR